MKKRWVFCGAVLAAAWAMADRRVPDATHFRYATPLRLPASTQDELAEAVLPPEAFAATRADLADLCVVRADTGERVPSLIESVTEERKRLVRQSVGLRMRKAEELDGHRLQVTLEREPTGRPQEPLCGVEIVTPLRDFERRVTVECSSDGNAWQPVVRDARLLDLSSHADFSLKEIGLPQVTQPFLRLTVDRMDEVRTGASASVTTSVGADGAVRNIERQIREEQRPFRIDRVCGWEEQPRWERDVRPLARREVRATAAQPAELRSRFPKARLICFEAGRAPLERVQTRSKMSILSLAYLLFERSGNAGDGGSEWRQTASGTVARLAFRDYLQDRMEIACAESRAAEYCLVLADGEAAGDLEVTGGAGPDYRVVFPYQAGQACTLLAVDPEASGPAGYEPEQVRVLVRRGFKPVGARLEGWRENPLWRPAGRSLFSAEAAWLLPAAAVLAIVVLGVAVALALRRMPAPQA